MSNRSELEKKAAEFERKAKFSAERFRQKKRFSGYPDKDELKKWGHKAFRNFRQASKYYDFLGKQKKSQETRKRALEFGDYMSSGFERYSVFAILAVLNLITASIFVSFKLTGSAIGASETSTLIGIVFFVMGLAFTFFYFKEKNKKNK